MKTETTKYYVVMKTSTKTNKLCCVGREGSYSAGASIHYGYKSKAAADKFASKVSGSVYGVQGKNYNELRNECDHFDLAADAEKQFN